MESMIGVTLKKIRTDKNIAIQTICEGVLDPATYWRLENGKIDTSFSTILRILERMNVSIEEFIEEFFAIEESLYQSYERELITYFKKQEVEKLKRLQHKLSEYFENKHSVKLTHLYYLADLYIAKLDATWNAEESKQAIKKYLAKCNNWHLYELTLLSNVLFIYELDISFHFYKTAINKRSKSKITPIISLTLNIMALCIEKNEQDKLQYLLAVLEKIELDEENTYALITRKWGIAITRYALFKDSQDLTEAKRILEILLALDMSDTYYHYHSQTDHFQKIIEK